MKIKHLYILVAIFLICGCARVNQIERGYLADPIMEPASQFSKQKLDEKFFSTREGSLGGESGIGGGCGCAK